MGTYRYIQYQLNSSTKQCHLWLSKHTDNSEVFPGSAMLALAQSANFIGLSDTHYFLLPTRLPDEGRLRSATCDAVRTISARAGGGRRPTWPLSPHFNPSLTHAFHFGYNINKGRHEDYQVSWGLWSRPTQITSALDIMAKLLSIGLESVGVPADDPFCTVPKWQLEYCLRAFNISYWG